MRRIARIYDGVGLVGLGWAVHSVVVSAAWAVDFGSDSMLDRLLIFWHGYDPTTIACIRHSCFTILKQPRMLPFFGTIYLRMNFVSSQSSCIPFHRSLPNLTAVPCAT